MIRVGIIGGSGYAAGELVRILLNHPDVELKWVHSRTVAGQRIVDVHQGLHGEIDMSFSNTIDLKNIDVLFCCRPAGKTREFIETHTIPEDLKIIDLARDHRIEDGSHDFVYGLSELNRKPMVRGAKHVANPGCLAMAVELSLIPPGQKPAAQLRHPHHHRHRSHKRRSRTPAHNPLCPAQRQHGGLPPLCPSADA